MVNKATSDIVIGPDSCCLVGYHIVESVYVPVHVQLIIKTNKERNPIPIITNWLGYLAVRMVENYDPVEFKILKKPDPLQDRHQFRSCFANSYTVAYNDVELRSHLDDGCETAAIILSVGGEYATSACKTSLRRIQGPNCVKPEDYYLVSFVNLVADTVHFLYYIFRCSWLVVLFQMRLDRRLVPSMAFLFAWMHSIRMMPITI